MNAYEFARAEATRVVEAAYHKAVAAGVLPEGDIPPVAVETPKDAANGDWASTFAMQCAKPLRTAPRKIAEAIVENLDLADSCFEMCIRDRSHWCVLESSAAVSRKY